MWLKSGVCFLPDFSGLCELLWPNVPQSAHSLAKVIPWYFCSEIPDWHLIYSGARETHPLLGGWPCNSGSFCPSGCHLCRVTWWPLYITPLFTPLSIFLWFQRNKSLHGSKVVCLPQSSKSINLGFSICVSRRKTEHQSQSFFKPWEKHKDGECFWIRILGQNPPHLFQPDQSLNEMNCLLLTCQFCNFFLGIILHP